MKFIIKIIISAISVLISAYVIPNVTVDSFITALIVAITLGVLNTFIKPILIILTLPINIITLGLFTLVINTALVIFASNLIDGFSVLSWFSAFLFSLVVSFVSSFLNEFIEN